MSESEESKSYADNAPWSARLPRMNPVRAFLTVFLAVFLFIFLGSAAVTFILPESYFAAARVLVPNASSIASLQSAQLLNSVARKLKLPESLAADYGDAKPWDEKRVEIFLRRSVMVQIVKPPDLIQIQAYSPSPEESARLVNAIAEEAQQESPETRIIDRASPAFYAARPNKPLNLALGAAVGILLGILAGGVGAKLAVGFEGPTSTGKSRRKNEA